MGASSKRRQYAEGMDERYPTGETASAAVAVVRHARGDADSYASWSTAVALVGGEATLSLPGHYAGVLAARLRSAAARWGDAARLGRDEYLDLTAVVRDGVESLALSSTVRSPVRVSVEAPRDELSDLATLLEDAQDLIETLRHGVGLVPDSLPDRL